ncbi:Syntaxin-related protein KNOLLE [Apostasia shenzhenica]|uniref:Syntaxin-related protein KNOLLE n=1 Tax=Apostasia shenzhenica TaxID=1088818 RepID=A0A2I0BAJ3_9ASPA|nr:Syntaxin-related protein KNOLLE [Apostasia shenzhenica]
MNNLMTRSFLSYAELKKQAMKDIEAGDEDAVLEIEMSNADESLRPFFEEAGLVKEEMASIRELLARMEEANKEGKSARRPEALRAIRDRIGALTVDILNRARRIRERLEGMDCDNAANRRLSGCRDGTPVDRSRTSVTNGLRKKLKEMMMDFQDLRQRMMAEHKEEVERRYFMVTGEVPPEEVVEKMISEGKSEELVRRSIVGDGRLLETVREIQDRRDAAKEVERSLLELHQVFLDMAVMVEVQGEKMDDIEHHVVSAAHYVRDGAKELNAARSYQKSSRKWLCIAILLLLIVVLLIVIPIAASISHS